MAGHLQDIQGWSHMLSMERTGSLSEELLKPATGTRTVHKILTLPGAWAPHLAPSVMAGILSCAGQEAAHAEEHGRSCLCPVHHPHRSLMISDHLHRIQVTLGQVCFQPHPELCGSCMLFYPLRELEEFYGRGRKEKCKCAGSQ